MENNTLSPVATFRQSYPLDFSLHDDNDQHVIYIDDDPLGHELTLDISNSSAQGIRLIPPALGTAIGPNNHHFELRFRPGTLTAVEQAILNDADWDLGHEIQNDGTLSLYLLCLEEHILASGEILTLILEHISADGRQGTRGTRVELRYQQMAYVNDDLGEINGRRFQHHSIINQRGRRNIPLHVSFLDGNTILNDGQTTNNLSLRISNALRNDNISLTGATSSTCGVGDTNASSFILSFDVQADGEQREWALATASQVANINVAIAGTGWKVCPAIEGESPIWRLTPTADLILTPGAHIQINLSGIISSLPAGHSNLYLYYENIPHYWDGQFIVNIEKSHLIVQENRVGIGTNAPNESLDVNGRIRSGSATMGSWPPNKNHIFFGANTLDQTKTQNYALLQVSQGNGVGRTYLNSPEDIRFRIRNQDKVTLTEHGRLGIGTTTPRYPLAIRGQETQEGLISFENQAGQTKWHLEQNFGGNRPGLNFVETGVADGRLFLAAGGNVGIGTTTPSARLHINDTTSPTLLNIVSGSRNTSEWTIRLHNVFNNKFQVGMRLDDDGFFYVTNRANLSNPATARLDSGGTWRALSDMAFKREIQPVTTLLDKVMALNPVSYRLKDQDETQQPHPIIGFIAQEVEPHFPHLVSGTDTKYFDYAGVGAIAIAAIQEMKQQYDEKIAELQKQVQELQRKAKNKQRKEEDESLRRSP